MISSFRLRLALLSALLSGLTLIAFGLGSWWLIRNIKIDRIDSEVRAHAEREVGRALADVNWQGMEGRLIGNLGLRESTDLLLLVQDSDGELIYRSRHWPLNLDAARLPWPKSGVAPTGSNFRWQLISEAQAAETMLLAQGRGPGGGGFGPGPGRPPPPGGDFPRGEPPPRPELPPRDAQVPADDLRPQSSAGAPPDRRPQGRPLPDPVIFPPVSPAPAQSVPQGVPTTASEPPPAPTLPSVQENLDRLPLPARPVRPLQGPPPVSAVISQSVDGQLWRIGLASTERARVAVAVNARAIESDMKGIRNAFLFTLPLALALIGLGGWVFSSRALRPLQKLTKATRKVTAEGLNQRISAVGEDKEFVELIDVYNRMLERLERSFQQAHRFSADAAHELKTPLAILQGQLERAINTTEDGSPMLAELTSILDEVRRLSTISRKLLLLSQADAGRLSVLREPFDLSRALADLVEDTRMLAPTLQVTAEIQPGVMVGADGSLLMQVLHNLISNAIKYNVEDGWIRIATVVWSQQVEVQVSNSSPGIPAGERSKIFERFYRADPAHSRKVEGVGLGLSVSREIARAHGGDITLKADSDGVVQFSLTLPAADVSKG